MSNTNGGQAGERFLIVHGTFGERDWYRVDRVATKEAAIAIADRVLGDVRVWDMVDDVLVYEARNEPR